MGGLLAFRVGNYDNTAEREQFRFLCEQLKSHYKDSNEFCVFAGNYNIGCELDALFIKKDAIIAIEFKNYGGNVVANENGEWTCDGKVIKGGSRKTVLQQARVNHSIVKKELKVLGVSSQNIKDVPTLVIFNQPVEVTNNLSATNKSWLHVTDNEHFIEKLDDITCPHTDLDPLGIVNLAELLGLNQFYLNEFSNAKYDSVSPKVKNIEVIENIKSDSITYKMIPLVEMSNDKIILLPKWLDDFIFSDLKATYSKTNKDMVVLDWSKKDILSYLGTYFPRSFAESYVIFNRFMKAHPQHFMNITSLNVFDFGCGTGGELIGFILALKEIYSNIQTVHIKALDGNIHALRLLEAITIELAKQINTEIILEPLPIVIDDFYDLGVVLETIDNTYDCIVSFKAICEFVTKQQLEEENPYGYIVKTLSPKLNDGGLLCLADITTYNDVSQEWLPRMMDSGLERSPLKVIESNLGYNEEFFISHSHKHRDISKVAWRILSTIK